MSKLQREIGKRQPFDSPQQEAVLNLFRASDRLQHRFTRFFAAYGLTASQFNILRILRGEGRPMQCMEIAERTITVVPGITGLIDRLEQKTPALVQRQRSREDRRVIFVSITEAGLELVGRIDEPLLELHRRLTASFSAAELTEIIRLMEKMRAGCDSEASSPIVPSEPRPSGSGGAKPAP